MAVTGLALALGMLGLQTPDIGVANRVLVGENSLDNISPRVDLLPLQEPARNVASHGNSNTEEVGVGLNGNLISGRRTLIYTEEATLKPELRIRMSRTGIPTATRRVQLAVSSFD